ncbi:hypothetical protein [Bradyrhizobium sp. STM 3557]|uniref:hypothetical protein n=1 Tax=Bradyrhizobium sp. STM 3557 TaxID=578920 RepID=UPI00388DEAAE
MLDSEHFFEYPINDLELDRGIAMAFNEFRRLVPEQSIFDRRLSFRFVEDDPSITVADAQIKDGLAER